MTLIAQRQFPGRKPKDPKDQRATHLFLCANQLACQHFEKDSVKKDRSYDLSAQRLIYAIGVLKLT